MGLLSLQFTTSESAFFQGTQQTPGLYPVKLMCADRNQTFKLQKTGLRHVGAFNYYSKVEGIVYRQRLPGQGSAVPPAGFHTLDSFSVAGFNAHSMCPTGANPHLPSASGLQQQLFKRADG